MTGLSIGWHLEDDFGERVEIEQKANYVGNSITTNDSNDRNRHYIRMVNILHYGVNVQKNLSMQNMWKRVKMYRMQLINKWKYEVYLQCDFLNFYDGQIGQMNFLHKGIIMHYLFDEEVYLNKPRGEFYPVYNRNITNSTLQAAAQMFLYLANCPSPDGFRKQLDYADFFYNDSSKNILEAILNINKIDARKIRKNQIWSKSVTEKMVELVEKKLNLKIGKLEIASSTSSKLLQNLGNVQFKRFSQDLKDCLHRNICTEVIKIVASTNK